MPLQDWKTLAEQAGDTDFTALPAADYDLRIIDAEAKNTSTGKTMFKITTEVMSGPYAKRRIWANLTVSPENPVALNIFFRQMAAIGIDKSYFATNPSDHNVAEELKGKTFRGQVVIKQWQGEDRNEIKSYSRTTNTESSSVGPTPQTAAPSPTNAPPAPTGVAPSPQPAAAPPAAAPQKTANADTSETVPVTQAETPAVEDKVEPETAVAAAPSAPDAPF